jgi:hypothetical protein
LSSTCSNNEIVPKNSIQAIDLLAELIADGEDISQELQDLQQRVAELAADLRRLAAGEQS